MPVDGDGIRVDLLRDSGAAAVILTPSHQWPTGSVLSARNRAAVIGWATERGAVIVEDDYDAECRYDRTPAGALQGLAPNHVVYAGSASKTLAPGLRLGWFVLPGHLTEPMAAAKIAADRGYPALEQVAFADFVHPRRVRPAPAADAPGLPAAARYPAGRAGAGICPGWNRPAYRPGCIWYLAAAAPRRGRGGRRGPAAGVGLDAGGRTGSPTRVQVA